LSFAGTGYACVDRLRPIFMFEDRHRALAADQHCGSFDLVRLRPVFDLQGLIDRHRVAAMRDDPGADHATRVCESAGPRAVTRRRVVLSPDADQAPHFVGGQRPGRGRLDMCASPPEVG